MKLRKKTAMLLSFSLGTLLLATTALADIASKSGYDQLKDALKVTAEQASEKLDSFTLDISSEMKENGKILTSSNEVRKFNRSQGATENRSKNVSFDGQSFSNYSYTDKNSMIHYSDQKPTVYVTEFMQPQDVKPFNNPLKDKGAEDIERIADAVVGSLKDHVVVTENPDGSKALSGSLNEVQIPSLINAVASFKLKQEFAGPRERQQVPHLTQDIFVKEVKGTAQINQNGILESILGTVIISGKDEAGQIHDVSVAVLGKVTGINATTISKPDLTGKEVVKETAKKAGYAPEIDNPNKFVGTFKNDIVIEKDGKYVKAGERLLEITHMDNQTVSGRYHEEFRPGFESYATEKRDFQFEGKFDRDGHHTTFSYTNKAGKTVYGDLYFDDRIGKIHLSFNQSMSEMNFDSEFSAALE